MNKYEEAMDRANIHIDALQNTGGSIQVLIDNIEYYFVADFGASLGFIAVSTYNEKYRDNKEYLDANNKTSTGWIQDEDYYHVLTGDERLENIYQQLANNPIQENVYIFF